MARLLTGAPVAARLMEDLAPRAAALKGRGVVPTLALLRVGDRPEDLAYAQAARRRCEAVGIAVKEINFTAGTPRDRVLSAVRAVNDDGDLHGLLVLRPLPDRGLEEAVAGLLDPAKDVDGMTRGSLAAVFTGMGPGFPPCTAQAVVELLDHYGVALAGRRVTVVGRSLVIGRPAAMLLLARNATVTLCHTGTADLAAECRRADVLVAAAGRPGVVGEGCLSPGQTVVDVGVNVDGEGNLCGDVSPTAAEAVAALTPVPGGVGAVTTAVLCKHVIQAAEGAAN